MLSPFIQNDKNLHLERFPPAQINRSLQAWDAADEYIINHITEEQLISSTSKVLIFNDSFGAVALNTPSSQIFSVSDSYVSHQGMYHNAELNNLEHQHIDMLSSVDELPDEVDVILFKIPKSKSLLSYQLSQIKAKYCEKVIFIAADRAKDIHSSTLKVFEKHLGETKTSLAVKKARLVFCQLNQANPIDIPEAKSWQLENSNFEIANLANVFAREQLDIGARFFLEHLPNKLNNKQVVDLGCGNGVIGLSALSANPEAGIYFTDESFMAVESAKRNVEKNMPESIDNCQFDVDDCLAKLPASSVDTILCNPPFHQQQAVTDHIAWQMFKDSYRTLKKGGELRIIGNRQLAYHVKLKRIFGNATTIASNKKFVILSARKK